MAEPTYCPICASRLVRREEGGRLRPVCDQCGYVYYHNPVPGVGLVIEMDGGIVLVQRGHPPHAGAWALPSGFVEADESAEEAAIREAAEETGLRIRIGEMLGVNSFPEGPPVSGIMIFFRAQPIGGELRAGDDAADVRVFQPDEVPPMPFRTHREMLSQWLAERQSPAAAPHTGQQPRFIIRSADPDDWEAVWALLQLIPANREMTRDEWREVELRFHESIGVETFVAEVTEQALIIGFVALSIVRGLTEGRGLINDMAVLPTYQRQGVGAALLEAAIRRANQRRLRSIMVNTQRANDQVRAFYAALGFAEGQIMRLKLR